LGIYSVLTFLFQEAEFSGSFKGQWFPPYMEEIKGPAGDCFVNESCQNKTDTHLDKLRGEKKLFFSRFRALFSYTFLIFFLQLFSLSVFLFRVKLCSRDVVMRHVF